MDKILIRFMSIPLRKYCVWLTTNLSGVILIRTLNNSMHSFSTLVAPRISRYITDMSNDWHPESPTPLVSHVAPAFRQKIRSRGFTNPKQYSAAPGSLHS